MNIVKVCAYLVKISVIVRGDIGRAYVYSIRNNARAIRNIVKVSVRI